MKIVYLTMIRHILICYKLCMMFIEICTMYSFHLSAAPLYIMRNMSCMLQYSHKTSGLNYILHGSNMGFCFLRLTTAKSQTWICINLFFMNF